MPIIESTKFPWVRVFVFGRRMFVSVFSSYRGALSFCVVFFYYLFLVFFRLCGVVLFCVGSVPHFRFSFLRE